MPSITWVYSLLSYGLVAGAGIGAIAWLIGYAISSIYNIIRRN